METTTITRKWEIKRKPIPIPTLETNSYPYSGSMQTPSLESFSSTEINLSGDTSAQMPGDYTLTMTPKNNWCWPDGTTGSKTLTWSIEGYTPVDVPTQSGTLTYTGNTLSPIWSGYDSTKLVLGGVTTGTNAGTYTATFTPADGYCWEDQTQTTKNVTWTIVQAAGSLTISPTSLSFSAAGSSHAKTITATSNNTGTATASSSDTGIATTSVSGKVVTVTPVAEGNATITVGMPADTNYFAPTSQTCSVMINIPPASLQDCTPAQIKAAVDGGMFEELYNVGDLTPLIYLNGTVAEQILDMNVRCRIVHIADGHPILQLAQDEAGNEISLVHSATYEWLIEANGNGFCINRKGQVGNTIDDTLDSNAQKYGPNKGGWENCYCRNTLMAQLLNCFPAEWQQIMRTSAIWTDNTCNGTDVSTNITQTQDNLFLPCEMNIYGTHSNGNRGMGTRESQWSWYAAGNNGASKRHDQPATACNWHLRDGTRNYRYYWNYVHTTGVIGNGGYPARSYGLRPCFSV